ncbi:MAG TPA: lipopolysaccharide heptosyltransferase II [Blastocatellia bacterium]
MKECFRLPVEAWMKVYLASLPSEKFSPEKIRRILVFAYQGLGNFILYTPALRLLRQRYPDARIDLQVGNNTGCEEVLEGARIFDNIYNLPYRAGAREWIKRADEIRAARYDLVINEFHSHSWKLALLVAASRAPFRAGHVTSPGWSHRFSRFSFIFNLPVMMQEDEHETRRYIDLVAAVGTHSDEAPKTFIHLEEADREFARKFLEGATARFSGAIIGVQPGTSPAMRWKQWPLDRFRELIERLSREYPDSVMILFGSAGESEMVADLAHGLGSNILVAAGRTTVKQVAALIERCDMLICNDSGLMHAAVAVSTPVVAIYGPTDIRRTAPLGEIHTVIRRELACSPCFRLEGEDQIHLCPHHDCLMTISVDEVFQRVRNKVSERRLVAAGRE